VSQTLEVHPYSAYNKATVVSEDNMAGIEAHIEDMNLQGFRLVNVIHMGIKLMMFWELIPR